MQSQIDINLYDRQIRTYGEDAVIKMASSSVTIIGLENGLCTEIAKNLTLGGIKNIYLYDNSLITKENLETGFYYNKGDIGLTKSIILKAKLQELNYYSTIHIINNYIDIPKKSIIILVNKSIEYVQYIDSNFKNKLVAVFSKGCAGMIFVNVRKNHLITDIISENIEPVQISTIDSLGKVHCVINHTHDFQSGDYITFSNLNGKNMEQFYNKEFQIDVISHTCFKLKNFELNDFVFINGTANYIKKSIYVSHQKFSKQLLKPTFNMTFDNSELIFNSFIDYFSKKIMNNNLINTFEYELLPVFSLIGSIGASEVIKLITNKYIPINQWWCWSDPILIPKQINLSGTTSISCLYGNEFENKLKKSSWFIVGSGAIGCELLKNLAFLNISSDGMIYITDPDIIEKSNLNRQFLFRNEHIKQLKSEIASEKIKLMKPIHIKALSEKVSRENQQFTDNIMKKVDGVFNALDNIEARRYMDEQCFNYKLPLFESGTTGTKGNTQSIIPFLTETYSASSDVTQEKTYPLCTIKSFPNEIQHTIHWAMDNFEFFNRAPININKWIKDNNIFNDNTVNNTLAKNDILVFLINPKITDFKSCIHMAINMFYKNYVFDIISLLKTYPSDHLNDEGELFWSHGKRQPTPLTLDLNNITHLEYIDTCSKMIATCYQINYILYKNDIKKISYTILENFTYNLDNTDFINDNTNYKHIKLICHDFDKDNELHIAYITATSNLRAINYNIPIETIQKTKGIAGRIIPAIATTTSVVAGLITLEMLKYMLSKENIINNTIDIYRSTFVNLTDTTLVYSEPLNAHTVEIAGIKFNNWTSFDYKKNTTLNEFIKYYENFFNITISMICYDSTILFANFMENNDNDTLLSDLIKEINNTINLLTDFIIINIATDDDNIFLPEIHIGPFI